jgi:hypothetical protein
LPRPSGNASSSTKLQRFAVETVPRSAIHGAPYNPRQIDVHALKKLRENIKRVGLLAPIVCNRRTGNIVSGHQRLACLDALEGGTSYRLQVAWVDLDEKTEREQVVFFNNEAAQGSFDIDKLEKMFSVEQVNFEHAGFEIADLQMLLPNWEPPELPESKSLTAAVADQAKQIEDLKRKKKEARNAAQKKDNPDFYVVMVFKDAAHCTEWLDKLHIDRREQYFTPERLVAAVQQYISEQPVAPPQPVNGKDQVHVSS